MSISISGDYIGVIYNRVDRTIAFTKNGVHLGVAFRNVYEERLYPTVPHLLVLQESLIQICMSISGSDNFEAA